MDLRLRFLGALFLLPLLIGRVAFAAALPQDVPQDAWYVEAFGAFEAEGVIDGDEPFRPGESATRAEFIELITRTGLMHDEYDSPPEEPYFTDVPADTPYFWNFQIAALGNWVRGAGNCLGEKLCFAYPTSPINRAEAAALIVRAFILVADGAAPHFDDVPPGSWYEDVIQVAADNCALQGDNRDDGLQTVRPEAFMNRAEMIVIVERARQFHRYGMDCGDIVKPTNEDTDPLRPPRHPEDETPEPRAFELPSTETPTGVPLMRFDMSAHKVKDIVLTGLTFEAAQGSLFNATKYALWVDHDRDGVVERPLEKNQGAKGATVTFQNFFGGGYIITSDTVTFEVRAVISGAPVSDTLQLRVTTNGIEAEELDGRALSGIRKDGICLGRCQINQQTTPAEVITILPQGNLFVSESTTGIRPRLLLGGSTTDPILRLTFRAGEEDIDVTELRISSSGSLATSIDRLELVKSGASTSFAEVTVSACGSSDLLTANPADSSPIQTFCASLPTGTLRVPEDQRTDILVRARMKSDAVGAVSAEKIQLWLTGQAVSENVTGSGSVKARGVSSSKRIVANDGDSSAEGELFLGRDSAGPNADIIGTLHTTTLSMITAVENGSSDGENSPIVTGTHAIGALRFYAASNANTQDGTNTVVIEDLLFTVSATNVTLDSSSFAIYNTIDHTVTDGCTAIDSSGTPLTGNITGSFLVSCTGLDATAVTTDIASGGSIVLTLKGTIVNPQVSGSVSSFLQLSLQNFTSPSSSFGVNGSHIHYLDQDGGGEEDVYWIDLPGSEVRSTQYRL